MTARLKNITYNKHWIIKHDFKYLKIWIYENYSILSAMNIDERREETLYLVLYKEGI